MKAKQEQQMNEFFRLSDTEHGRHIAATISVNDQLDHMDIQSITQAITLFDLLPIQYYLPVYATEEHAGTCDLELFVGYMKYVDAYLIQKSGGRRENLQRLAMRLTGSAVDESTARIMRLEILHRIFAPYLTKENVASLVV